MNGVGHWCCIRVSIRIVLSLSQNYIIRCFNRSICGFPYPFNINNATNVICVSMILSIHIPIVIIVVNMSISSSINRSSCSCLDRSCLYGACTTILLKLKYICIAMICNIQKRIWQQCSARLNTFQQMASSRLKGTIGADVRRDIYNRTTAQKETTPRSLLYIG